MRHVLLACAAAVGAGCAMQPTTPESESELQLAENQAAFLFAALRASDAGTRALEDAAKASDNLQESMERLARLYNAP